MKERLTGIVPIRKVNSAYFHYRTNRWRWNARFRKDTDQRLDRPIYLIGTQGGGLTLLSRILHRHRHAVSVTGDSSNWAGEDEAQNALEPILPEDFGWRRIDLPGYPSRDHSWLYANDDFLPHYRRTAEDAVPEVGARYRTIIAGVVRMNARGEGPARFIDKSQSLTVRVGFVHALLADCAPSFVLVTRNPYALVWSQATANSVVARLDRSLEDRVRLCAQHWRNSVEAALADAGRDDGIRLRTWRFEFDPALAGRDRGRDMRFRRSAARRGDPARTARPDSVGLAPRRIQPAQVVPVAHRRE